MRRIDPIILTHVKVEVSSQKNPEQSYTSEYEIDRKDVYYIGRITDNTNDQKPIGLSVSQDTYDSPEFPFSRAILQLYKGQVSIKGKQNKIETRARGEKFIFTIFAKKTAEEDIIGADSVATVTVEPRYYIKE